MGADRADPTFTLPPRPAPDPPPPRPAPRTALRRAGRLRPVPPTPPQPPAPRPAGPRALPCTYEGPVALWCHAAGEDRKARACEHPRAEWDWCQRGQGPQHSCAGCGLYRVPEPPAPDDGYVRHLLYHVLPVSGNGRWQWNVGELAKRLHLFNGRRVCAVLWQPGRGRPYRHRPGTVRPDGARVPAALDPPEAVEEALAGRGFEFVRVENDPNLREVASHGPLFGRLEDCRGPKDVALYAHAKGVTRRPGHTAERWAATLYEASLDYWPAVRQLLARSPLAGCFKKLGPGWRPEQSNSDWHYSGSWFWFRCADLYAKDWRRIDRFWSGIEPYPSQHFRCDEAAVLFYEGRMGVRTNLYDHGYWDAFVSGEWERWKSEHVSDRTGTGS